MWLVVVNPSAGTKRKDPALVRRLLDEERLEYRIVETHTIEDADQAVADALHDGVSRFAAVGGDGSAHVLVNAVMGHEPTERPRFALLPAGSGTDLSRTFALPRTLEESVAVLRSGSPYTMDLGRVELADGTTRWFLNVVDIGIAAASVRTAGRIPRRIGAIRYPAAFWLTLPVFRPRRVVVRSERRTVEETALNVVVANGQFFGGGMNIAPQAAISDGLLDVEVFAGPRFRAFGVMPRVIRGLHLRHKAVTTMRAAAFEIDVPKHWPVEADGDVVGAGPAKVSVAPSAIDLMI